MSCPDIFSRFLSLSFSQEHLWALTSMLFPNVDEWNLQTSEQKNDTPFLFSQSDFCGARATKTDYERVHMTILHPCDKQPHLESTFL